MTTLITDNGYLETAYLSEEPYLGGNRAYGAGLQFSVLIPDAQKAKGLQFQGRVDETDARGLQFEGNISATRRAGVQFLANVGDNVPRGLQFQGRVDTMKAKGLQFESQIFEDRRTPFQFEARVDTSRRAGIQFQGFNPNGLNRTGLQFRGGGFPQYICGGYLEDAPYLQEYPYLAPIRCRAPGLQIRAVIDETERRGVQFEARVDQAERWGLQFEGRVDKNKPLGIQFEPVTARLFGLQFRVALYNTTNLRILTEFPSRGIDGTSWSASSTQASSSSAFAPTNLNTDIVEQYWRSADGQKVVTLDCDTGENRPAFIDTLAILNHNFTRGATVRVYFSNDNFGSVDQTIELSPEQPNIFWIAPSLPLVSYRWVRVEVSDNSNPDNFIRIGTIVFGSSVIFSGENFVDRVTFGQKHFTDKVFTEGHTNVSNDRGKKKFVQVDFRQLRYDLPNFRNLRTVFEVAGTTLKCLWIPDPRVPSRFAVFGKLRDMPTETHNYRGPTADYVDLSVDVDESL
jgi:hypothetical protein